MSQCFIKLRNAIFAESGYSLANVTLTKNSSAQFCTLGDDGKPLQFEPVPGCDGADAESFINITLTPYANPAIAAEAVKVMCGQLADAVKGDAEARDVLAAAWAFMLSDGVAIARQVPATQLGLLKSVYGAARLTAAMDRRDRKANTLLAQCQLPAMVSEALVLQGQCQDMPNLF